MKKRIPPMQTGRGRAVAVGAGVLSLAALIAAGVTVGVFPFELRYDVADIRKLIDEDLSRPMRSSGESVDKAFEQETDERLVELLIASLGSPPKDGERLAAQGTTLRVAGKIRFQIAVYDIIEKIRRAIAESEEQSPTGKARPPWGRC